MATLSNISPTPTNEARRARAEAQRTERAQYLADLMTDGRYLDLLRTRARIAVDEAAAILGLGRTAAYKAAARGQLADGVPVVRVGPRKYAVGTAHIRRVLGIDE
jgi:hypothetical protein